MRTIKFRVWDKTVNKMMQECYPVKGNNRIWTIYNSQGFIVINKDAFELMQFTGLLDKNSKEIYEEDILECHDGYMPCKNVIKWVEHAFWITSEFGEYYLPNQERRYIIGNIYENPELIDK
jgi:uncharacterized phage protein (TIGR01671 family)